MVGWHWQWTWFWANSWMVVDRVDGDGQGSLACCCPWGRKESDTTEWLNWTELRIFDLLNCCVAWMLSSQTLWGLVDCSPPGSSVHGILQARILEWAAISSSRGSFQLRNWTSICGTGCRFFIFEHQGRSPQMIQMNLFTKQKWI